jgi:hypothetical protein
LANGIYVDNTTFNQSQIDEFRASLYKLFSAKVVPNGVDPKTSLPADYIYQLFPILKEFEKDCLTPKEEKEVLEYEEDGKDEDEVEIKEEENEEISKKGKGEQDLMAGGEEEEEEDQEEDKKPAAKTSNDKNMNAIESKIINVEPGIVNDFIFHDMFLKEMKTLTSQEELTVLISDYEAKSNHRLVISKSYGNTRFYKCWSHVNCSFFARFGPCRNSKNIVLKKHSIIHTDLLECPTAKGRKWKTRQVNKLEKSVEHVTLCKEDSSNARDVMKTTANIHANVAT